MTLDQARQAFPGATFERRYDGEGIGSVGVVVGGDSLMTLTADDDDGESIDWTKTVAFVETWNPGCATAEGVRPGALVLDVEKVLGRTAKIVLGEIEARQYITFERQPPGPIFRLDYTGRFDDGARETTRFDPEARIFSIAISR